MFDIIGIPEKGRRSVLPTINKRETWDFTIQEHLAERRGKHFDIRLGSPNGVGFSWASESLPEIGQQVSAVQVDDHSLDYFNFSGTIEKGYGKGTVKVVAGGKVEIINSSPEKVTFYFYPGTKTVKYSFVNLGTSWLFVNHTLNSKTKSLIEQPSLKYYDHQKYTPKTTDIQTPKIDGASATTILLGNKLPLVYSKRISKKDNLPIEYTSKLDYLLDKPVPKELGTTILRTEVYGIKKETHREVPNRILGGILNSNVWKSREEQKNKKVSVGLAAFDILKYKGKDVSNLPYRQKMNLIDDVAKIYPSITTPWKLGETIKFKEGKVSWQDNVPYKLKKRPDYDVHIREVFPNKNNNMAGGFKYSLTTDGPIVGAVGTGFNHNELKDMLNNPDEYIGRVAKVNAFEQYPSGALRAPSFSNLHLDK